MPRNKAVDPPELVKYYIPTSMKFRLDALLFSPELGKIPPGAISRFHKAVIGEALNRLSREDLEQLYGKEGKGNG